MTDTQNELKSASLYFTNGSSDKEYHANIEASGDGYTVTFRYGRRGTSLTTGTKTQTPVDYDKAVSIFDKLVKEKSSKGYTPGEDGTPYLHSDKAVSGLLPQLLNVIDDRELLPPLANRLHEQLLQEQQRYIPGDY
jgi:bifunctional non-homologous end joining protein LigD